MVPPASRVAVGVDLGGTKIAAGLYDEEGRELSELFTAPTEAQGPREGTIRNLVGVVGAALSRARELGIEPAGIGVGSTGPLDPVRGVILEAETLPNLFYFPLREALRSHFGLPLSITNDGNAFALAEARFGAGKGHGIVVGVTLGTGCGCGIVVHGKILEGATANAGEVYRAPLPGGTFDGVLSGGGLSRELERASGRRLRGEEISRLAETGDPQALEACRAFGEAVAHGIGTLAAVLDPGVCVLGGSVTAAFRHFAPSLRASLPKFVAPQVAVNLQIVPSSLGPRAGALGGAALVFSGATLR